MINSDTSEVFLRYEPGVQTHTHQHRPTQQLPARTQTALEALDLAPYRSHVIKEGNSARRSQNTRHCVTRRPHEHTSQSHERAQGTSPPIPEPPSNPLAHVQHRRLRRARVPRLSDDSARAHAYRSAGAIVARLIKSLIDHTVHTLLYNTRCRGHHQFGHEFIMNADIRRFATTALLCVY